MKCPICHKPVNFGLQMMAWDDQFGDELRLDLAEDAIVPIYCNQCGEIVSVVIGGEIDIEYEPELLN